MLIDLLNNKIFIDDSSSKLNTAHISQIKFWGFIRLPLNNTFELLTENTDPTLKKLLEYFENEQIAYTLSPSCQEHITILNQKITRFENIKKMGQEYKDGKFNSEEFKTFESFICKNIHRKLKSHQIKAAFHLYLLGNGANFSVPGSGKTAVVLAVYEKLKAEDKVNTLLIVGPPSCFGPWRTEFQTTLCRIPDYKILSGGDRTQRKLEYYSVTEKRAELYITTYQTLLNDQNEMLTFLNHQNNNVFLVIDEAHYMKQIGGNWAKAVLHLADYVKYKCVLTGTPLPKSYSDIFNLFDFLWPYDNPIDSSTKIHIQLQEEKTDTVSIKEILEQKIGPLFYRVRKRDLGLISPIFHPPRVLTMNKYEKLIYDAIDKKIRNYAKEDYLRNIDLVMRLRRGRIIRLRQCVSYIKLLSTAIENYDESIIDNSSDLSRIIYDYGTLELPAKLEYLLELVKQFKEQNQKIVIWANFIGTLELIFNQLNKKGFYCKLIYGKTPIEQTSIEEEETRERIRNEFVEPTSGLDILIANPAACAESISLHKTCYHAIYYDLSYNCGQYLQSLDRIHRVGGSETMQANYYFLQYENTIDQDIIANLNKKANKMFQVIDGDYNVYSMDMFEEGDEVAAYERLFKE